jgi:hemerythrin superfamily protein
MRAEHRDIEMLLEGIRGTVGVPGSAAETLRAELVRVLGEHNEKEEQVLYPGTDKLLTREESDALVARIQEA